MFSAIEERGRRPKRLIGELPRLQEARNRSGGFSSITSKEGSIPWKPKNSPRKILENRQGAAHGCLWSGLTIAGKDTLGEALVAGPPA
jgi:hypothetical protein